MRTISFAALVACAAACSPADGDLADRRADARAGLGRCTQEEPGASPDEGHAVFYVDRTPTASDGEVGRYAVMLTCMTPGPGGTAITLMLPNLADSLVQPGRFRIHGPGVVPGADQLARLSWAEAQVPADDGVTYRGMAGELVIERDPAGGLVGSYLVALERAPEGPARGPERMVVGGGFAAPRNRLRLRAALPRQAP